MTGVTPELAQLYALRAQLDAIILGKEREDGLHEPVPPVVEGCQHPADAQKDATTIGGKRRVFCMVCNTEHDA